MSTSRQLMLLVIASTLALLCQGCPTSTRPVGQLDADSPGEDLGYSAPECGAEHATIIFRLDFTTLELIGYEVQLPQGRAVSQEEALQKAWDDFANLTRDMEPYLGLEDWEENPFSLDPDLAGSHLYLAEYPPSDFGGRVVIDARQGVSALIAMMVWVGQGEVLWPIDFQQEDLLLASQEAPEPAVFSEIDKSVGTWCYREDNPDPVCPTGREAFDSLRRTVLLNDLAACGEYEVLALAQPSGALSGKESMEWVVIATGMSTREQVNRFIKPD